MPARLRAHLPNASVKFFLVVMNYQRSLVVFFLYKKNSHAGFCRQHSTDPSMDEQVYLIYIYIIYQETPPFFYFL
jgi:hypothetical protein